MKLSIKPFKERLMHWKFPSWISKFYSQWIFLWIFLFFSFILINFPTHRLLALFHASFDTQMQALQIPISFISERLSLFPPSYEMDEFRFQVPTSREPGMIQQVRFIPAFLPWIIGKTAGTVSLLHQKGKLQLKFSFKNTPKSFPLSLSLESEQFDFGSTKLLNLGLPIEIHGLLNASGELSGDLYLADQWTGPLKIHATSITIPPQTVLGFSIPKLILSELRTTLQFDRSQIQIRDFQIGTLASDDIRGTLSGTLKPGKTWYATQIQLKLTFNLSETIFKSFIFLEPLLKEWKQLDGSYALQLSGSLWAPTMNAL